MWKRTRRWCWWLTRQADTLAAQLPRTSRLRSARRRRRKGVVTKTVFLAEGVMLGGYYHQWVPFADYDEVEDPGCAMGHSGLD